MDILSFVLLFGGLALFLYGMHFMGINLSKLSGGRMEQILGRLTASPAKAVMLGTVVTAVIQSSSATTVMVVGFVNSGLMTLHQAVGVIMGANIGTTVTSWILSLAGVESSHFLVRMLKPDFFSPILGLLGIFLYLTAKERKKKNIGGIFLGFAILMTGMEAMSGAVSPLKEMPAFQELFVLFSHPILGMLLGALLTAVIQSSSASIGILQALCATGAVSYGSAIPIIMGQNIGTCATALLSSARTGKNAKRAAFIHLYFNLIGTALFMAVFYALHALRPFAFLAESADGAGIAAAHSIFNITVTILLFPLRGALEKLACLTVRDKKEHYRPTPGASVLFPGRCR